MPIGDFVNLIPAPIFLLIHLTLFAAGAYFAWRSFEADASLLGWGFSLFALAELRRCAGSQFDPVAVEAFHEACAAQHPAAELRRS